MFYYQFSIFFNICLFLQKPAIQTVVKLLQLTIESPRMSEFNPCYRKRQQQFQKQIRKEQRENIFRRQRLKHMEILLQKEEALLAIELNTHQKRSLWIINKAYQLKGIPTSNWVYTLKQLMRSISFFEGYFNQWLETGIIESLVELLKQQHKEVKLSAWACRIIYSIIYQPKTPQTFISKLTNYESIIIDLVELCYDVNATCQDITQYLILLSNICQYSQELRLKTVISGGVTLIKYIFDKQITDNELLQTSLIFMKAILSIFEDDNRKIHPKINIILICIPFVNNYIAKSLSNKNLQIILRIIKQMLGDFNRQVILANIYNSQNIPVILLQCITHLQYQIRCLSLQNIGYLMTSRKKQITSNFVKAGIFDKMITCRKIRQNSKIIGLLLSIITNIAGNTNQDIEMLMKHQIFNIVIQYCHFNQPTALFRQASYIICTILISQHYNFCQHLIRQHKIIQVIMKSLQWSKSHENDITKQFLLGIKSLITIYTQVYTQGGRNKVLDLLLRIYNFDTLLDQLSKSKNKTIAALSDAIIQTIHTTNNYIDI